MRRKVCSIQGHGDDDAVVLRVGRGFDLAPILAPVPAHVLAPVRDLDNTGRIPGLDPPGSIDHRPFGSNDRSLPRTVLVVGVDHIRGNKCRSVMILTDLRRYGGE